MVHLMFDEGGLPLPCPVLRACSRRRRRRRRRGNSSDSGVNSSRACVCRVGGAEGRKLWSAPARPPYPLALVDQSTLSPVYTHTPLLLLVARWHCVCVCREDQGAWGAGHCLLYTRIVSIYALKSTHAFIHLDVSLPVFTALLGRFLHPMCVCVCCI